MMARPFNGFGEAAKLYAANAPIIDEMFRAFYEDMTNFCEALGEAIKGYVPDELFKSNTSKEVAEADGLPKYQFAWLADDDKPWQRHAYLWMDLWDSSLVTSNELLLKSSAPNLSDEQLNRLWTIPGDERFKDFCTLKGRKRWSIFRVHIQLPPNDPIDFAAERIAAVLKAMYKAETGKALP